MNDNHITPSHTKRVAVKPRAMRRYSPVELVMRYGDSWALYVENNSTRVSLYESGPDMDDFIAMKHHEMGLTPRVGK